MTINVPTSERERFAAAQVGRWRGILESASVALGVAIFVTIVGVCLSASGTPEETVLDNWGRVGEISGRLVIWELVAMLFVALLLALPLRVLFTWPDSANQGVVRTGLVLAIVNTVLLVIADDRGNNLGVPRKVRGLREPYERQDCPAGLLQRRGAGRRDDLQPRNPRRAPRCGNRRRERPLAGTWATFAGAAAWL